MKSNFRDYFQRLSIAWLFVVLAGCAGLPGNPERYETAPAIAGAAANSPLAIAYAQEQAVSGGPILSGNKVDLLIDGPATHETQLAAIAAAKHHIHLETFLLFDEQLGRRYEQALVAKAKQGVTVRIMYDGLGSMAGRRLLPLRMKIAGIQIREYNPVNPLKEPRLWRINRRNHRKIMVVDGKVGFTGGINITDEYLQASQGKNLEGEAGWRDTHLRITGPAVTELQKLFARQWQEAEPFLSDMITDTIDGVFQPVADLFDVDLISPDVARDNKNYFPEQPKTGNDTVRVHISRGKNFADLLLQRPRQLGRIVRGKPAHKNRGLYESYLAMVLSAQKSIWISQAYFVPNNRFVNALKAAAARGVDVKLLLPRNNNHKVMLHASRHYYERLLAAGIQVYEYEGPMMHAKTAVIDGVWSTVGSSNLDFRSLLHNDEANAVILGAHFGAEMQHMFRQDLLRANAIQLDVWRKRSTRQKAKERAAALAKYWI